MCSLTVGVLLFWNYSRRKFSESRNIAMFTVFVQNGIPLRGVSWIFTRKRPALMGCLMYRCECLVTPPRFRTLFQPKSGHNTSLLLIFSVSCCRVNSRLQGLPCDGLFSRISYCDCVDRCFLFAAGSLQRPAALAGWLWKQSWHNNKRLKYNMKFCP